MGGDGLEDGGPGGGGVAGVEVEGEEDVNGAGEGEGEEEEEGCDEGGDVHYGGRDGWRWDLGGGAPPRGDFRSEKKGRSLVPACVAYNGTGISTGNPLCCGNSWITLYWKLP